MVLRRAPLLLLGAVLGSFMVGAFCGSPSNSLCYSYLQLSEPSQGLPRFFIRGYLDDQPITRFDSLTGRMEPLVPWMEEKEKETFLAPEWVFRADLEKLSKRDHPVGGLRTWQVDLGCELKEDGSKGGFLHYGYDGMDFISFDKETLRWVTAQLQAQKVKEKWEEDPGWTEKIKVYLEETCIEWLQRYLSYRKEAPQKIEPPVGKVTHKVADDSLEVLICQAFGFYPKEIQAIWTRDGEACVYETLPRNVAPNSDGTYYVWLSIEIDPKEKDHFQCHLEHEGLQEPLVLAFKEESATGWLIPVGIVAASILVLGIFFLICQWWRFRKKFHRKVTTFPHQVSREKLPSSTIYGTEDEIQSQLMLQPKVSSEHNTTYGRWRPKRALEDVVSSLPNREQKLLTIVAVANLDADAALYDDDAFDAVLGAFDAVLDASTLGAAAVFHTALDAFDAAVDAFVAALDDDALEAALDALDAALDVVGRKKKSGNHEKSQEKSKND